MRILGSNKNNKRSRVVKNIKSIRNKEYIRDGGKEDFLLRTVNSIEKDEGFIKNGKVGLRMIILKN